MTTEHINCGSIAAVAISVNDNKSLSPKEIIYITLTMQHKENPSLFRILVSKYIQI